MVDDRRLGRLQGLARELGERGLVARVVRTRSGPVFCRVVNPEAASMTENVTCAPALDPGAVPDMTTAPEAAEPLYFWWSWGERMHPSDDPGGAAVKVAHVLKPHPA